MIRSFTGLPVVAAFFLMAGAANGDDAVAAKAGRVDGLVEELLREEQVPASPLADDAEFLRRVTLDLTGQIPTYERAVAFLADQGTDRRARLIDELLASAEFGQHLATVWSRPLLGNEIGGAQREAFRRWLAAEINQGRGWDGIVHALLAAEGEYKDNPAAVFVLAQTDDGQLRPNLMAAATTRYFLGVQLQCAECHDHPFTEWKQTEFWGMAAFFSRVRVAAADKKNKDGPRGLTEAPDPKKKAGATSANITIPVSAGAAAGKAVPATYLEGGEAPLDGAAALRPALAGWVTSPDNQFFARAAVNRLWFGLFGRGLVHPVDDMHADNPPSHPELLQFLADEFKASGFSLRHVLRCVCNSRAYQRTSRPVDGNADDRACFSHMAVKQMSPEVLHDALTRALGVKELNVTTGVASTTGKGGAKAGLGSSRDRFVSFFKTQDADAQPTDFTHGIPQVLNLMNDPQFTGGGPVIDRLVSARLPRDGALGRLYLTVLSRRPTDAERARLHRFLDGEPDGRRGYAAVLWALVNSPEFILNH